MVKLKNVYLLKDIMEKGYDPIVYVPEYEMTTGEMAPELKNSISHRGKALEQMKEILKRKLDLN